MASYPTYDNRWFIGGLPQAKFEQLFPDGPNSPLVNRAISGRYQLGSTMKLFTSVAALASGIVPNPNWAIDDGGEYEIPDCVEGQQCIFKNAGNAIYGRINLPAALTVSSDVYFYTLGVDMFLDPRPQLMQTEIRKFGLGSETGIDLPFEYDGVVPDKDYKQKLYELGAIKKDSSGYYTGDNLQLAIGQGLLTATPLQLTAGYGAFANGGTVWEPHVVSAIYPPGAPDAGSGRVDLTGIPPLRTIDPVVKSSVPLPPEWRDAIVGGLVGVLRNPRGTAYDTFQSYDYNRFPIAGKTGTAQSGSKKSEEDDSLFAGFGPISPDQPPQYVIGAVLEDAGYGSWSAAPVTKCLFEVLSGARVASEPQQADLLDRNSDRAAVLDDPPDASCLAVPNTGRD
jgi:penicillin-binding protein 2